MKRVTPIGWLHHDVTHRGITAWLLSAFILGFYIVLYFGHRLASGQWNTMETGVFAILALLGAGIVGYSVWSDLQEPDSLRSEQLKGTITNAIAGFALLGFVFATPMLLRALGDSDIGKMMSQIEWGATGHIFFQILYGAILGSGVVGIFAYRKDNKQPTRILGLLLALFVATLVILILGAFLINVGTEAPKKKLPTFSITYGVTTGLALLKWGLMGFGGTVLLGIIGVNIKRSREGKHGGLPVPQSNQRFVGLVLMLSFLFTFVALVHATPTIIGALHAKKDPFDVLAISMGLSNKWMFYGLLYTVCITSGGSYMIWKYWHNKYQVVRTCFVMFIQATLAFSIPWIMKLFQRPDYYFSYIWPLKVDYFYPSTIAYQMNNGLPVPIIVYSFVAGLVLAPVFALLFGKRWYCSWMCGCGGLSNTFGEPWRHLSNKSSKAWLFEKFSIHTVMILTFILTILSLASSYWMPQSKELATVTQQFRGLYGLGVSAVLSGVIGVGLYPLGGTRVWCRFACPMAAMLGLIQKFGRFRIRVKKDMCISCGLCSKYCEMGIDVRSYAQANQSFTRASCVGCGLCSEVCPRGVLRLENAKAQSAAPPSIGKA